MGKLRFTLQPSQWINTGWILFGLLGGFLLVFTHPFFGIFPLFALYKIYEVSCWRYDFYDDMIIERKGVFLVTHKEINYYRIKSVFVEEPLLYRLVDMGKIHVVTSDKYATNWGTGSFTLVGVSMVNDVARSLREKTMTGRKKNNVREFDMYNM
jgi:membrane protein YdbS with pleckstrin-like domain